MPGRLFLTRDLDAIAVWTGAQIKGIETSPRRNIAPGEEILVCNQDRELVMMRWGMIPVGRVNARGRPVMDTIINARSESVFDKSAFAGVARAVVLADGWYEWTGEARKKTAWSIARKDRQLIAFAAIADRWKAPGGRIVDQVAAVTCPPSADLRDIHHRMGVILERHQIEIWLNSDEDQAANLMKPFGDGQLLVKNAQDVDWNAP